MAKNKNGQTVKNKKYYKNKNTSNNSKKKKKTQNKKVDTNVSIIVDDKKESLNYNIVEESFDNVPEEKEEIKAPVVEDTEIAQKIPNDEEEFDYRTKKAKLDRKIKTNFIEEEEPQDKFVFTEEPVKEEKSKKKKKTNKKKKKPQDTKPVQEEEPIVINVNDYNSVNEYDLIDDSVELPLKINKEVYEQNKAKEDKDLVDKAFEETTEDAGDIDKPAIFKNISVEDSSFRGFIVKFIVLLIILILSIFFVINFSAKYMASTTSKDVGYFESSDVDYSLCNKGKCSSTNIIDRYVNTVNINFEYDLSFDEKINFEGKYNVVAKFNINDDKTGDVLYTETKNIKKDTFKEKNIQDFEIKEDAILLLDDYNKFLEKYNKERKTNYTGEVRVNLYVDGVNGKKRVASLLVPLQENQQVEKTIISYQAGDASIEDDGTHYGKVYVYLIIVSLILVVASSIGVVLLLSGADEEEDD